MTTPLPLSVHQNNLHYLTQVNGQVELMQGKLEQKKDRKLLGIGYETGKAVGIYLSKKLMLEDANRKLEEGIEKLKKRHVKELSCVVDGYEKKSSFVQEKLAEIIQIIDLHVDQVKKKPCGSLQINSLPFKNFKDSISKIDYDRLKKYPKYPETLAHEAILQESSSAPLAYSCLSPILALQAYKKSPKRLEFNQNAFPALHPEQENLMEKSDLDEAPPSKVESELAIESFVQEHEAEFQMLVKETMSLEFINQNLLKKQEDMIKFNSSFLNEFKRKMEKEMDFKQIISKIRSLISEINWGFRAADCPGCPYSRDTPSTRRICHNRTKQKNEENLSMLERSVVAIVDVLEDLIDPEIKKR